MSLPRAPEGGGEQEACCPVDMLALASFTAPGTLLSYKAVANVEFVISIQDLGLILDLFSTLLSADPSQAQPLLGVTITYSSGQQMDWLDVTIAAINALTSCASKGVLPPAGTISLPTATRSKGSDGTAVLLSMMANCLQIITALARVQPGRVMGAVGGCMLFEGVVMVEQMQRVPLEQVARLDRTQLAAAYDMRLGHLEVRGMGVD